MTDEEWDQTRQHAVDVSRQVGLRRVKLVCFAVAVLAVAVGIGAAAATYFGQQEDINAGVSLADQVSAACARGDIGDAATRDRLCPKAAEVQETVEQGPQGIAGADGRDGADGADGSPGPMGPTGRPGRDGRDGEDGTDGTDGVDGADSVVPGPAGAPGSPGADSTIPGPQGEKGEAGDRGRGVESVECSSGTGTFTFHYTDGSTETVTCEPEAPSDPASPSPAGPMAARR